MKKILRATLLMAMALLPLSSVAESATQLVLTLTNSTTETFWLSDRPIVTFGTTELTVTAGETVYTVERNLVSTFTFEEKEVEGVKVIGTIEGQGTHCLYDINGRLIQERDINTQNLPAGTYILKVGGQKAVKIVKK